MTSALDGDEWSASSPQRKSSWYPLYRRLSEKNYNHEPWYTMEQSPLEASHEIIILLWNPAIH
jgi:hypothetical protein